jgi:hypothetical protein
MRIRKNNTQIHNTGFNKIVDPENATYFHVIPDSGSGSDPKTSKSKKVRIRNTTSVAFSKITGTYAKVFF